MRYAAVFALTATLLAACNPAPENKAPTVTLTPAAAQSVVKDVPAAKLTANATDDGTIAKVEFLDGATVVATDTSAPYEYTPPTATVGEKTYIAKAYDDKGLTGVSAGVKVTVTPVVVPDTAKVRGVHAVSDLGGVDLLVNAVVAGAKLTYTNVFPGKNNQYADVPTTAIMVKVCATGTSTCPIALNPTLPKDSKTTVLAVGTADAADDTGADARPIEALVLTDNGVVDAAQAKVRVVHAAAVVAAKSVDVYVTAPAADLAAATTTPTYTALLYKGFKEYVALPVGSYRIRITPAGAKTPVLIDTGAGGIGLAAGKLYTTVAVNPVGGDAATGIVLLNDN
jgi:hypothetical protein